MAAWHAFIRAHARVVRLLEAELEAEQGLSLPAYEVLAHLSEAPGGRLRMSDLAGVSVLAVPSTARAQQVFTDVLTLRRVHAAPSQCMR